MAYFTFIWAKSIFMHNFDSHQSSFHLGSIVDLRGNNVLPALDRNIPLLDHTRAVNGYELCVEQFFVKLDQPLPGYILERRFDRFRRVRRLDLIRIGTAADYRHHAEQHMQQLDWQNSQLSHFFTEKRNFLLAVLIWWCFQVSIVWKTMYG